MTPRLTRRAAISREQRELDAAGKLYTPARDGMTPRGAGLVRETSALWQDMTPAERRRDVIRQGVGVIEVRMTHRILLLMGGDIAGPRQRR